MDALTETGKFRVLDLLAAELSSQRLLERAREQAASVRTPTGQGTQDRFPWEQQES